MVILPESLLELVLPRLTCFALFCKPDQSVNARTNRPERDRTGGKRMNKKLVNGQLVEQENKSNRWNWGQMFSC